MDWAALEDDQWLMMPPGRPPDMRLPHLHDPVRTGPEPGMSVPSTALI